MNSLPQPTRSRLVLAFLTSVVCAGLMPGCSPHDPAFSAQHPTPESPIFPTFPPNTPLPFGGIGTSVGRALASMSGQAGVGQPALDPISGTPLFIWSQSNTDQAVDAEHAVYLRWTDPLSGALSDIQSVNVAAPRPGFKTVYRDSAVAVSPDGVRHALYCERRADGSYTDALYRRTTGLENGRSQWTDPVRLGAPSPSWCNNLRLKAAPDGSLLAIWAGGNPQRPNPPDSFVRVLKKSPHGAWQDVSPPRLTRDRQFEADIEYLPLIESQGGGFRTFLVYDDGGNVYATYSDPGDEGRWRSSVELVNGEAMNRRLGIRDYLPAHIRVLAFWHDGRPFVYAFWNIYSTGRIAYIYSSDTDAPGGPQWTGEDSFAYFPPSDGNNTPEPLPSPDEADEAGEGEDNSDSESLALDNPRTKVHMPEPFWAPERKRVFVVYRYCRWTCYAAYAYALPDAPGGAWQGGVGPYWDDQPLRAFPPTQYEAMRDLQSANALDSSGAAWLSWLEGGPSKEVFFGALWPSLLISANNQP